MKKKFLTAAALTAAAITLVVATVFTTIAYLTASSAVSNTFTVGDVNIAMYESNVDDDGKKLDDTALHGTMKDSDGNNYHLIPGAKYDKDPTVYIDAASDSSFVFVKVRNNIRNIEKGEFVHADGTSQAEKDPENPTIAEQLAAFGWQFYISTPTGDVYIYVGNVDEAKAVGGVMNGAQLTGDDLTAVINKAKQPAVVGGKKKEQVFDLFRTFTIDEHADVSTYGGAKVTLTAFAIQTKGFVDNPETLDKNEAIDAAWAAVVETYSYEDGAKANE